MLKIAAAARGFVRDEEGATMAEYALMVALIAVVCIVGASLLGTSINERFGTVAGNIAAGK